MNVYASFAKVRHSVEHDFLAVYSTRLSRRNSLMRRTSS